MKRHQEILVSAAAVAALFVLRESAKAQGDRKTPQGEAVMHSAATGFLLLDDARRFDDLLLKGDASAAVRLSLQRKTLREVVDFEAGQRVAVDQDADDRLGQDEFRRWHCVRPEGDPRCYWVLGLDLFGEDR